MQNPASIALLNEFTANDNFNGQKAQWRTFCNHALEFRLAAMRPRPNRFSKPGPSTTNATIPCATMCSAVSWRCCSKRSWSDAGNFSDWATLRKISGWFPREGRPCTIFFLSAGTWGPEDTQWLLAQGHNWPLPTEL